MREGWRGCALALTAAVLLAGTLESRAQMLARPRWAGSGMRTEHWWQNAVLYAVQPGETAGDTRSPLEQLTARLGDLEALGIDAILLRGVDAAAEPGQATTASASPLSAKYGSVEEFDRLLTEASRRRLRILVEVRPGPTDALIGRARFWLSRGVTGLYLRSGPYLSSGPAQAPVVGTSQAEVLALRSVLRGFVGERVLLGDAPDSAGADTARDAGGAATPDLLLTPLRGLGGADGSWLDLQVLRQSLDALARPGRGERVSEVAETQHGGVAKARARTTVLLSARGGVLLGVEDLGAAATPLQPGAATKAAAGTAPAPDPLFTWTNRMVGLHRGNATMRDGAQTVLDRDADGALVMVWRGGGVRPQVLVEIVNLTGKPLAFSLVDDVARLRLRGSFLRTVLRSDNGMGAMPLRAVALPAYGVYLGELGR